jgi:hypothetical protein
MADILALADRINAAPTGITRKDAAIQLVEEGQASSEDAYLALLTARFLTIPRCEVCGKPLTNKEHCQGVLCTPCHDEMFGDVEWSASLGPRTVRM